MKLSVHPAYYKLKRFLWGMSLFLLPVTSFRYLPLGSGTQVRPLSLVPLGGLLVVLLLESVEKRRFLLKNSVASLLLAFVLVALMATMVGGWIGVPNLYEYTYASRVVRAWVSLGMGILFFLVPAAMNRNEEDLRFTLKWLYWGLVLHVFGAVMQLTNYYVLETVFEDQPSLADLVDPVQKKIMMAGLPVNRRISGMALEPSWLASQIASTYFPWCFAAWLAGYSWIRRRQLLGVSAICLLLAALTFSRTGLLVIAGAGLLTFLLTGQEHLRRAWQWFWSPFRTHGMHKRRQELAQRIALLILMAAAAGGIFLFLGSNHYFAQLWEARSTSLTDYFVDIYAGPRLALAQAGWQVFEKYPWSGVGLGAAGFYLHQFLPDWSHFNILETAELLSPDNTVFPNTKNLYIRLLAETGIFGFWIFIAFYFVLIGKSLAWAKSSDSFKRFVGIGGLFGVLAVAALGLSFDSLANPMIWVTPGILLGLSDALLTEGHLSG